MNQKTAMITGANRGLGFEAARLFLETGSRVVFAGRSWGAREEARRQLDPEGTRSSTLELNMTSLGLVHSVPGQLEAAGIQVDVLVNNAGVFPRQGDPVEGLVLALETNVTGPVALTVSTHLALNARNCWVQEIVRAFYYGWYGDFVTELPPIEKGRITVPAGAGLGAALQPEVKRRADVTVRVSTAADF